MKFILRLFLIITLTFCLKESFSQSKYFANTFDGKSKIYGIGSNRVFKLDSLGNSIWVKDFTGYIVNSPFQNVLTSCAFDGKYVYVSSLQGTNTMSTPQNFYSAITKLDTLGNIIFVKVDSILPTPVYQYTLFGIYPSYRGGIWILDDRVTGTTQRAYMYNMNDTGHITVVKGFWYNSRAYMGDFLNLPDSNSIVCVNHYTNIFPSSGYPALMKLDNNGAIIWKANYTDVNYTYLFQEKKFIHDDNGNIYLMCNYYPMQKLLALKINSSGNILLSKLFNDLPGNTIEAVRFESGNIICRINSSEVYFDTLLNNPCLTYQNLPIQRRNDYVSAIVNPNFKNKTFVPVNSGNFTWNLNSLPDYCATIDIKEYDNSLTGFKIFPNPAINTISIESNFSGYYSIIISDLQGKHVLKKDLFNEYKLEIEDLKPGVYFVNIKSETVNLYKKIIIHQ